MSCSTATSLRPEYVCILALGGWGDVQPLCVLALELNRYKPVCLITHQHFYQRLHDFLEFHYPNHDKLMILPLELPTLLQSNTCSTQHYGSTAMSDLDLENNILLKQELMRLEKDSYEYNESAYTILTEYVLLYQALSTHIKCVGLVFNLFCLVGLHLSHELGIFILILSLSLFLSRC